MSDILLKYWKAYLMISHVQIIAVDNSLIDLGQLFTWDYLIEHKIVLIQPETSKLYMPITLGYEQIKALSFNKGCYVGQEILARVHFKGSVKRAVVKVTMDTAIALEANQDITNESHKVVGHIALLPEPNAAVHHSLAVISKTSLNEQLFLNDEAIVIC